MALDMDPQFLAYLQANGLSVPTAPPPVLPPMNTPSAPPIAPIEQPAPVAAPLPVEPVAPMPEVEPQLPLPQPAPMTADGPTQAIAGLDPSVHQAASGPSDFAAPPPLPAEMNPLDLMSPEFAQQIGQSDDLGQVGHQRKTAADHEQSLSEQEYLALNPLERAAYDFDQNAKLERFVNAENEKIRKTAAEEAEEREREYMDSQQRAKEITEAALADSEALANEKPKKYMDSIGNAVGAVLGIVMGQFATDATGGKNVGLEMVNRQMDAFAQDQINEYNRKSGAVDRKLNIAARLREAGYNEFQTKTVIQMAGLQRMREQLLTDAQNFDPRGTQAQQRGKFIMQTEAQLMQHAEAMRRQSIDDQRAAAEEARKQRKADDDHLAAQGKLRGAGGSGTGAGKSDALVMQPDDFVAQGLSRPPTAMSMKDWRRWVKDAKDSANLTKADQDAIAGQSQGMSKEEAERGIAGLKQSDGRPFIAQGTPEEVGQLRKRVAATKTVVRILDKIDRTRTGWSSDLAKSDEWKQLKTEWAAAKGVAKDVLGLGALSGPDEALIENFLSGGIDPTGMRDPGPGLERARQNMLDMTSDSLETAGYDGKFNIPKPKLGPAISNPSDERFKRAQQKPMLESLINATSGEVKGKTTADLAKPFVAPGDDPTLDNVVLPEVRREIDALVNAARGDDPAKASEAIEKLGSLVETGGNSGTKRAARAALESAGRPTESYEEITGRTSQGARETVPAPRGK